jgi:hypothetical protein
MESCRTTRDCKKVLLRIEAQYFCCNSLCKVTVNEISEGCMCIKIDCFIPLNSRIELLIPFKMDTLNVPVRVKGHLRAAYQHDVMNVEVFKPSRQYLDFVNSINPDS